jgi:hypothetical protein
MTYVISCELRQLRKLIRVIGAIRGYFFGIGTAPDVGRKTWLLNVA